MEQSLHMMNLNLQKSSLQQTQPWNTNVKYTCTCDWKRTKDECEKGHQSANEDNIFVYSSFKQFCLLFLCFQCPGYCTALNLDNSFIYKCLLQNLVRSGNAGRWILIINYTSILQTFCLFSKNFLNRGFWYNQPSI